MPLLKPPNTPRARIGEQRSPGEVIPVTTRTIVGLGAGVVALVVLATAAILWASSGPAKHTATDNNLPQGGVTTYVASYSETVQGSKREVVSATLSLSCGSTCTQGDYTGYAGDFSLTVNGSKLTGTSHTSCLTNVLTLQANLSFAVPEQLPQTLTGTLARSSTCDGPGVGAPATLELHRTR
jgi:hypothetical protein